MTAPFIYEPIINTDSTKPYEVLKLGNRIVDPGAFKHPIEFPDMPYTSIEFTNELTKLLNLDSNSKGNTDILLLCGEQCTKVYNMIKEIYVYVYPICYNNLDLIIMSGFESNSPAKKHQVIGPVVIKSIAADNDPASIKILIEQLEGDEKSIAAAKTFIVYVFEDMTSDAVRVGCITTDSRKLIVDKVPIMKVQYYAIVVQNSAGNGPMSARRNFTLTE